jgi:hypothetical protein
MIIALRALALASFLSLGKSYDSDPSTFLSNETLDISLRKQTSGMLMHGPECYRIEETAKLEGIIFEQASQRLLLSVLGVLSQHYVSTPALLQVLLKVGPLGLSIEA